MSLSQMLARLKEAKQERAARAVEGSADELYEALDDASMVLRRR